MKKKTLKRYVCLILSAILFVSVLPANIFAEESDNRYEICNNSYTISTNGCVIDDIVEDAVPEEYGEDYSDPNAYTINITGIEADGTFSFLIDPVFVEEGYYYTEADFPIISTIGYTQQEINDWFDEFDYDNPDVYLIIPEARLESIIESSSNSYSIKLQDGEASLILFVHRDERFCFDWEMEDAMPMAPSVLIFNFKVTAAPEYGLKKAVPAVGQFEIEDNLYSGAKTAYVVTPYATEKFNTELWFESSDLEVIVNGGAAVVPDSDHKAVVELISNTSGYSNTILVTHGEEEVATYTILAISQRYPGLPDSVVEYLCIGSQYTNREGADDYGLRGVRSLVGSNDDAGGGKSGPVSLGNFGGYVIYYYENAIFDDPNNPYGIDFITFGNSVEGSNEFAEPGQVWVSEDANTWYPLAGSLHYDDSTSWNTTLTYSKSDDGTSIIRLEDGTVIKQEQFQFPIPERYPWYSFGADSGADITLNGIYISADASGVRPMFPVFGYTDVGQKGTVLESDGSTQWDESEIEAKLSRNIAGNPYLGNYESGGRKFLSVTDGMDLSWAVDPETGLPVTIQNGIHYVKIVTASNINAGAIGEKSTEVNMVRVAQANDSAVGISVAPNSIKFDGKEVTLSSGTQISDNVFSFTGDAAVVVKGAFDVEVDAGEESNVFINNNKAATYSYEAVPDHGIIRVIVQDGIKEPLIYVFSLNAVEQTQEEIDQEAAEVVDRLIEAIGEVTLQSKTAIEEARAAYDALTDAQKALVTKLDVLEAAEAAYAALAAQDFGTVHVVVENTTYSKADGAPWDGTLVDTTVELTADSSMIGVVAQAVEAAGYTQTGAANGYISEINGLKQFDGGTDSGWMGMLNDWVTNQGFDAFTVANGKLEGGDEIHIFYTVTGLGTEGSETSLADLKASVGELSPEFDPETLTYTLTVPAGTEEVRLTPSATDKNFYVSIKSGGTEYKRTKNIPVADGTVITLEVGAPTMNTGFTPTTYKVVIAVETSDAVKRVEDLIDAIGEVTADSGDAILAARTAYDALTDEEKAQVSNYADLQAAEEAFAALSEAAVKAVEDLIDAIPDPVTEDDKAAIEAARAAYDALTDEQKAKVENYEDLLAAEAALEKLQNAEVEDIFKNTGDYIEALIKEKGLTVNPIGGEWAVIGLARAGREVPDLDKYLEKVDEFIAENINESEQLHRALSTENSRLILALTALGKDVSDANGHDLVAGLSDLSFVKKQGINGPVWALIALDAHAYEPAEGATATRDALIEEILAAQLADGGWVLSSTATSADGDMTGMALQALAPYYKTNDKVKAAVDKALDCLSNMQNAAGGFGSLQGGGATLESGAQVIVALTALGIDPATDERFVKNGLSVLDDLCRYYVEGGGFEHVAGGGVDGMATEQGYYALAAYFRFKDNKTSLYDMSDVEIETSEEPAEPTEDEKAAAAVDEKIAAIGDVTLDSEEAIEAAREAYDALTEDQKALVKNLADLEAAEKKLAELKEEKAAEEAAAEKAEADRKAAAAADEKIAAIGDVTLDSEDAIKAAREAYDALTEDQKALVKNLADLEAAEKKLAELKEEKAAEEAAAEKAEADKKAAAAADEKIAAIGDVTLDSEDAIKAARAAYDALTEDQKALVKNLADLEAAEKKLAELKGEKAAQEAAAKEGLITKAVDKNGKPVAYTFADVDKANELTKPIAVKVNNKLNDEELITILWQKDVKVAEGTEFPVTLTFAVPKEYQDQTIYVYHYNGSAWEVVGEGTGAEVSATFDKLSPVGLVAAKTEAETPDVPKTGDDNNLFLWAGAFVTAVASAVYVAGRKRREE